MKIIGAIFFTIISFALNAQMGKVGINTSIPSAMLHVKDSSVVFTGASPLPPIPGSPPVSGEGTRMMWYANKAAFRVGRLSNTNALDWDKDSIGFHSVAMGINTKAKGNSSFACGSSAQARGSFSIAMGSVPLASGTHSVAIGENAKATGLNSVSIGNNTLASGEDCFAFGVNSIASGINSTAFGTSTKASSFLAFAAGFESKASGFYSTAIGKNVIAKSYNCTVFGQLNDTTSISSGSWDLLDPLFIIGNGILANSRKNAFTVLKNGNIGIGTIAPQKLLHVSFGSSGATPVASSMVVIETVGDAAINLLTHSTSESALYFGNALNAAHGGIVYNSTVANGLDFRTNGNSTKMVINDAGDVGIGDNSPNARLHISEGTGGGFYNANAEVIIEDDDQAYIQFSVPTTEESGILSGNGVASMRSGVLFRADSSVQIRSGGNTTRLVVTKAGDIGIGTLSPSAKLDVNGTVNISGASTFNGATDLNGTLTIGPNGTAITEMIKSTVSKDVPSIAAGSSVNVDFTVANAATTSTVYISPELDLTSGIIIGYARVHSTGTVRVRFTNISGAAIDLGSMNYYITVIR